jgi:tRNA(fMet)-specific endonuclease VapC
VDEARFAWLSWGGAVDNAEALLRSDQHAVDKTIAVKAMLADSGMTLGGNDTAIAGHAIAAGCILVTDNVREFARVEGLAYEDWVH